MLPEHVLGDVPFDEWRSHPFNTGEGTYDVNGYTAYGPIGCGPYWYMAYDPTTFTNFMGKFDSDLGAMGDYWILPLWKLMDCMRFKSIVYNS